jgi:hypothetical protein
MYKYQQECIYLILFQVMKKEHVRLEYTLRDTEKVHSVA